MIPRDTGDVFILQRTGRRKGKGKRRKVKLDTAPAAAQPKHDPGLKVMYKLREDVPVKPVLGFVQTCHEVAKEAPAIFAQELTNALRTAR